MNTKAIAYLSRTNKDFSQSDISTLLVSARNNNAAHNVTGVLLYNTGFFFQYIEGCEDAITTIYERIQQARSHQILLEVFNDTVDELHFSSWHMGFCFAPEGFIQELSQNNWLDILPEIEQKKEKTPGLEMLFTFWNNMSRNLKS
jgi:hypothetical protein